MQGTDHGIPYGYTPAMGGTIILATSGTTVEITGTTDAFVTINNSTNRFKYVYLPTYYMQQSYADERVTKFLLAEPYKYRNSWKSSGSTFDTDFKSFSNNVDDNMSKTVWCAFLNRIILSCQRSKVYKDLGTSITFGTGSGTGTRTKSLGTYNSSTYEDTFKNLDPSFAIGTMRNEYYDAYLSLLGPTYNRILLFLPDMRLKFPVGAQDSLATPFFGDLYGYNSNRTSANRTTSVGEYDDGYFTKRDKALYAFTGKTSN